VAAGVLLALNKADSIDEAEAMILKIRPKAKISEELKEDLQKIFPDK